MIMPKIEPETAEAKAFGVVGVTPGAGVTAR